MEGRWDRLPAWARGWVRAASLLGLTLILYYLLGSPLVGFALLDFSYYWLLLALYLPVVFLLFPARPQDTRPRWYDYALALGVSAAGVFLAHHGPSMVLRPWTNPEAPWQVALALFLLGVVLEGARRVGGMGFALVALVLAAYPLLAPYLPGLLWGPSLPWQEVLGYAIYSTQGLMGLPMRTVGELLVGFLVLAAFLVALGAGQVFLEVASALFGWARGGAAKVSVVASAFFGSLSGSILSNVASTGSLTIPAMIRSGFSRSYAAAVEACASTGGVLMPPVMGAVAFVMANLLGVPYGQVVAAALLPSLLYYLSLFAHVDLYAARHGLRGLPRAELPPLGPSLGRGLPFLMALGFLVFALLYLRLERLAPFYALGFLLLAAGRRLRWEALDRALVGAASLIGQTLALILPVGLILAGLVGTGVAPALTGALVRMGAENLYLVLLVGVAIAFVLGMAGVMVAAYILLAVTLAPALVRIGEFNPLAVHLFIAYWSMLSAITPPVAVAAFLAARIAGASPMGASFTAVRLGLAIYFLPFFFLFEPALILQGSLFSVAYHVVFAVLGLLFLVGALEGYFWGLGPLPLWARGVFGVGGILCAIPETLTSFLALPGLLLVALALGLRRRVGQRGGMEG
ncbi:MULTISPECIES: TRAP transporter permease [Thermus]|jgi:TRAP transporter 4TM/12TM fusion protein|uniref:C4-dicarboxylate ABC transporter n=2 Tax=Thermus TaxID=270 RepID=A0A1J0LQK1_THEBO|nr:MULTISPECIES: TRAP transporter fused permease subunit [Thermus]APD08292.1 large integral membrane transport protein [Thermus brockianus]WCM39680.1 TRAP transporter fused permease subunit [Thermus antranikianii]BDG16370.1 C4-dicarboxylate ABC transporter [Thermus brockianus]